jgi:hypothetical protein
MNLVLFSGISKGYCFQIYYKIGMVNFNLDNLENIFDQLTFSDVEDICCCSSGPRRFKAGLTKTG